MDIDDLIAHAKRKQSKAKPVDQVVMIGGREVTVRIYPVDGTTWDTLTAKNPPRLNVAKDIELGYDLLGVLRDYPEIAIVDGEEVDNLKRVNPEGQAYSMWPEICAVLGGPSLDALKFAIWGKNVHEASKREERLGKGSKGKRSKKRR